MTVAFFQFIARKSMQRFTIDKRFFSVSFCQSSFTFVLRNIFQNEIWMHSAFQCWCLLTCQIVDSIQFSSCWWLKNSFSELEFGKTFCFVISVPSIWHCLVSDFFDVSHCSVRFECVFVCVQKVPKCSLLLATISAIESENTIVCVCVCVCHASILSIQVVVIYFPFHLMISHSIVIGCMRLRFSQ